MRIAFCVLLLLTGCEMLAPNGNGKQTPKPVPAAQVVELRIIVDGEGKISLAGAGDINVKSLKASESDECECGCGKKGCQCTRDNETQDLGGGASSDAVDRKTRTAVEDLTKLKKSRDIIVISTQGCLACDLAAADMRLLGFDVKVVYDQQARQYPTLKNRRGDTYEIDDGYWNTGDDDIRAAKKLAE